MAVTATGPPKKASQNCEVSRKGGRVSTVGGHPESDGVQRSDSRSSMVMYRRRRASIRQPAAQARPRKTQLYSGLADCSSLPPGLKLWIANGRWEQLRMKRARTAIGVGGLLGAWLWPMRG